MLGHFDFALGDKDAVSADFDRSNGSVLRTGRGAEETRTAHGNALHDIQAKLLVLVSERCRSSSDERGSSGTCCRILGDAERGSKHPAIDFGAVHKLPGEDE